MKRLFTPNYEITKKNGKNGWLSVCGFISNNSNLYYYSTINCFSNVNQRLVTVIYLYSNGNFIYQKII